MLYFGLIVEKQHGFSLDGTIVTGDFQNLVWEIRHKMALGLAGFRFSTSTYWTNNQFVLNAIWWFLSIFSDPHNTQKSRRRLSYCWPQLPSRRRCLHSGEILKCCDRVCLHDLVNCVKWIGAWEFLTFKLKWLKECQIKWTGLRRGVGLQNQLWGWRLCILKRRWRERPWTTQVLDWERKVPAEIMRLML